MNGKIKSWLMRYLPAESVALISALIGGLLADSFFHNSVATALGGTWGENIGYYGTIITRDIKDLKNKHKKLTLEMIIKLIRNLFVEFGPAEYLDSLFVRPFAMYFFPILMNNIALGLIIGKFAADGVFYIPTIVLFEFRKKYLKS